VWIALAVSLVLHLLPLGVFALLPAARPAPDQQNQGTVELLMEERKGAEPGAAPQQDSSRPVPPKRKSEAPVTPRAPAGQPPAGDPAAAEPAQPAPVSTATRDPDGEPVGGKPRGEPDGKQPGKTAAAQPQPQPQPPQPQPPQPPLPEPPRPAAPSSAPVFDFAGTESDTNATVMSGAILPAMPDDRSRNRPPIYPADAAMRGETGSVLVLIHVSAYGTAIGSDLIRSSGSASLDRAALTAVRKWHFHPAMKDGQAVPFDMPFNFVFAAQ
jgi:protein TonB